VKKAAVVGLLAFWFLSCTGPGRQREAASSSVAAPTTSFPGFVDDYFRGYYQFFPSEGTSAGFHEYDSRLEDFSLPRIKTRSAELRQQLSTLENLRKGKLSADAEIDAEILDGKIRAELLDIDDIHWWRRNAIPYVSAPGQAADLIMKRSFASPEERLRVLIARMEGIEKLLASMRNNVTDPPRELTELASRICTGSIGFFRDSVAKWAKAAAGSNDALLTNFEAVNRKALAAFEVTANFLSVDQLPLATGSYAIGPDAFLKKLRYEEMIDLPLDRLQAIGEAQLNKDYKDFVATARRIQPKASPAEVMRSLSNQHPTEDQLLNFAKSTLESIRQFVVSKKIVTIPSEVRPTVLETPPYARSGTFASMDTPGAFENVAKEAFYYVTPPEQEWTRAHKEEHLRLFNKPVLDIITIHEAFPGHYTQFLYAKEFPSKTRKALSTHSNAEGWAHYAEQMMLEEGFGGGDPKVRLAQLSEALLRDCRYIAGIRLHTQNETVEQAARLFIERGFQEPANANEEARRGAYDPTYLYYTAGKLQIYELREDYKRAKGADYSLQKFHEDFIKQGSIPVKLIRRILLKGDQSPVL
jgi:uncharacterized protein (DUF885 family)